jgi:hypothetical protein
MTILAGMYFIPAVMVAFNTPHLIAHDFMKIACGAGTYCKIFCFIHSEPVLSAMRCDGCRAPIAVKLREHRFNDFRFNLGQVITVCNMPI